MPGNPAPPPSRQAMLDALAREHFDVLVVGGGITGCGIARDAALRGLRVALVEKDDFASGTSSRSSRLIHGGLRYLEHGHLHLVFEASAERRRLLRLAPHLVRPLEFVWPVYAGARVPRWKLSAGLALYDALSLFRNVSPHQRLNTTETLQREPMLRRDGLRGGARYFDAGTDDARLTLANAIGAVEAGAVVANHAALRELHWHNDAVDRASVEDRLTGSRIDVRARVVVNATGPWSDAVRRLMEPGAPPADAHLRGSKGVHIAVPRTRLGNGGALTLLSPSDGRVMFVLPGGPDGEQAIIGTTETETAASPDEVRASAADITYLLDSANEFFPQAHLTRADVMSSWAGIRPLIARNGDAGSASREHEVLAAAHGIVSITGGKLTTYRVMADDVLREVAPMLRHRLTSPSPTRSQVLPGGDVDPRQAESEATNAIGDAALARHLVRSYGSRWRAAWHLINEDDGAERLDASLPYRFGEIRYAIRFELAFTLGDLLIRRTHLAFETRDHGREAARRLVPLVASELDWNHEQRSAALDEYESEAARLFGVEANASVA